MHKLGRYRIQQKLGEGGMGVVYKAEDRESGEVVALKVLHPWLRADPESRARFVREGKAVEKLDHPAIAALREFGEVLLPEGHTMYMAMEFVPGRDLQQRQAVEGFDQKTIVSIAIQLAQALQAAHQQGIVHRDLKPANVRMSREGKVKILDFGLAKILNPETVESSPDSTPLFESRIGIVLGSAPYSAPEQMMGEAPDPRADLFSLGVMLYQMVTDRVPFRGSTPSDVLVELQEKAVPSRELCPAVAPGLDAIIMKLLAPRPSERFQTAQELLEALEALRADEGKELERSLEPDEEPAQAGGSAEHGASRDWSLLARIGVALVVLLVVGLVLWLVLWWTLG